MNCNIIKDLLPLYADGVCSPESSKLIEGHLAECKECQKILADMQAQISTPDSMPRPTFKSKKIGLWKASLLQSIFMLVSFWIITVGVSLEAKTPIGLSNGFWAFIMVIPATGFMLSAVNWYFIRLYRSKRRFVVASVAGCVLAILACHIWGLYHYEMLSAAFCFEGYYGWMFGIGLMNTLILCGVSWISACFYADYIGKI
ncbi:MAG: hypothetical protein E7616_06140 [Ruminococcaceae bacterium]|nr:hypothetical protein [Oscillospiraceae bacterium]